MRISRPRDVVAAVDTALAGDTQWRHILSSAQSIHLGVFVEPFLTYVLQGMKTVESRFSITRSAPYNRVAAGDVLLLKRSSGPVVGLAHVESSQSVELGTATWPHVRSLATELCANEGFWTDRAHKRYATLIRLKSVRVLERPLAIEKKDPRPWVVLREQTTSDLPFLA